MVPGSALVHDLFAAVGVLVGAWVFVLQIRYRRRVTGQPVDDRIWTVVAGVLVGGALLGRLGTWAQHFDLRANANIVEQWVYGNRSILSGLVGAYFGALLAKRLTGYRAKTGDLFAPAVAAGMAVGRIGCLLTELPGTPTGFAWGVTAWDTIPRHPSFAYEIAFHTLAFLILLRLRPHLLPTAAVTALPPAATQPTASPATAAAPTTALATAAGPAPAAAPATAAPAAEPACAPTTQCTAEAVSLATAPPTATIPPTAEATSAASAPSSASPSAIDAPAGSGEGVHGDAGDAFGRATALPGASPAGEAFGRATALTGTSLGPNHRNHRNHPNGPDRPNSPDRLDGPDHLDGPGSVASTPPLGPATALPSRGSETGPLSPDETTVPSEPAIAGAGEPHVFATTTGTDQTRAPAAGDGRALPAATHAAGPNRTVVHASLAASTPKTDRAASTGARHAAPGGVVGGLAPQRVTPRGAASQSLASEGVAPQSAAPQSAAPQSVAPQSVARLDAVAGGAGSGSGSLGVPQPVGRDGRGKGEGEAAGNQAPRPEYSPAAGAARRYPEGILFNGFVVAYGVFRFAVEFVRGNEVVFAGLTRPQWFLLAVAPLVVWRVGRRMRRAREGVA